ncbi:MAG: acyltransferase [Paludibacteraceae bacterium]|nr:acyltransferase [Paludibacteraceae bacterium]
MNQFSLTKGDTAVLKGVAICAMLLHHLYGCPPDGVLPYSGLLGWLGGLGKVCVALFLFCSGYGLSAQYKADRSLKDSICFILRRLIKFYTNYWVVFVIFVPITYFVFGRTLIDAYSDHVNIPKRFIYDIFAVQGPPYNVTWWFNKLIIVLYILFPILYKTTRFNSWLTLLISLALMRLSCRIQLPYDNVEICTWQFPFILGIVWRQSEQKFDTLSEWMKTHSITSAFIALTLLCVTVVVRMYPIIPHWNDVRIDGFVSCSIALCVITILRFLPKTMELLAFLGKHSMNIYMTHTFINGYWHPEWLHTGDLMRNGGSFIVLMVLCIIISICLEYLKEKCRIYKLSNKICNRLKPI